MRPSFVLCAAAVVVLPAAANAAILSFNSRPAWIAAAGTTDITENFASFAVDTSFNLSPLAVAAGKAELSREGTSVVGVFQAIDVPPINISNDANTSDGSAFAYLFTNFQEGPNPGTQVRMSFPTPVRAFGLDTWLGVVLEGATIDIVNTQGQVLGTLTPGMAGGAFTGFIATADEQIGSLLFRSTMLAAGGGGEAFGIDNLIGATTIPAPGCAALILASGFVAARRRRLAA